MQGFASWNYEKYKYFPEFYYSFCLKHYNINFQNQEVKWAKTKVFAIWVFNIKF